MKDAHVAAQHARFDRISNPEQSLSQGVLPTRPALISCGSAQLGKPVFGCGERHVTLQR